MVKDIVVFSSLIIKRHYRTFSHIESKCFTIRYAAQTANYLVRKRLGVYAIEQVNGRHTVFGGMEVYRILSARFGGVAILHNLVTSRRQVHRHVIVQYLLRIVILINFSHKLACHDGEPTLLHVCALNLHPVALYAFGHAIRTYLHTLAAYKVILHKAAISVSGFAFKLNEVILVSVFIGAQTHFLHLAARLADTERTAYRTHLVYYQLMRNKGFSHLYIVYFQRIFGAFFRAAVEYLPPMTHEVRSKVFLHLAHHLAESVKHLVSCASCAPYKSVEPCAK